MPLDSTRRCFNELSWPQVEQAVAIDRATLVWPFGACEQHGPHLPLATDALFADRLLDAVLEKLPPESPIWRLPVQAIGFSPEHVGFSGTLSFSSRLLISMVVELGEQLAAMGWRRLVLFNAHGGQIALLQVAARELRKRCPSLSVLPCFLWSGVEGLTSLIAEPEGRPISSCHQASPSAPATLRWSPARLQHPAWCFLQPQRRSGRGTCCAVPAGASSRWPSFQLRSPRSARPKNCEPFCYAAGNQKYCQGPEASTSFGGA